MKIIDHFFSQGQLKSVVKLTEFENQQQQFPSIIVNTFRKVVERDTTSCPPTETTKAIPNWMTKCMFGKSEIFGNSIPSPENSQHMLHQMML